MELTIMDKAEIVRIIEESFQDTVPPEHSESALFATEDIGIPDMMDMMEMIEGKDWKGFLDILETPPFPVAALFAHEMAYFMTHQAFHYFAPAYLIYALDKEADYPDTPSAFLNQLAPPSGIPFYEAEEFNPLLKLFSVPQKRAIANVIDYRIRPNTRDELLRRCRTWPLLAQMDRIDGCNLTSTNNARNISTGRSRLSGGRLRSTLHPCPRSW
jgi:hypothetical protein